MNIYQKLILLQLLQFKDCAKERTNAKLQALSPDFNGTFPGQPSELYIDTRDGLIAEGYIRESKEDMLGYMGTRQVIYPQWCYKLAVHFNPEDLT